MSAPTTESIRAMLAHGEESIAGKRVGQSTVDDIAVAGAVEITRVLALPLAEHRDAAVAERDALAAEVARLRADIEMFQRSASQAEQTRRGLAAEVERLRAILECESSPYGMRRCCHCDSEVT